jgi:hypothetical protein
MAKKRRSKDDLKEIDVLVERLREFVRLNYMTAAEVARQIGVNDTTVYSWLLGQARPAEPKRITTFLDSLPRENGSGMAPTRYQYREYKNWRGVPKPRRCPFCKQAKGEIRRKRGGFLGVCPNCDASGPKRESYDHARDYYQPERLILCGKTWMTVRFATAPDHLTNSLTLARDSLSNTEVIPHYHRRESANGISP